MPLYEADGKKQKPIARTGTDFYSHAVCPTNEVVTKRPSYVNVNSVGVYAFAYKSGSVSTYVTGSKVNHANAGGIRLDINPVAWRRTDAADAVGDITFVYVRVS